MFDEELEVEYVIIADWEDMRSDDPYPMKTFGVEYGRYDTWGDAQGDLKWLRENYWEHGYCNIQLEERYK